MSVTAIATTMPGLLAAFLDAAMIENGQPPDPVHLFDAGQSAIHQTIHEKQPDGQVAARIILDCGAIKDEFARILAAGPVPRIEHKMQRHAAHFEMLESIGPVTIEHPAAMLNQGFLMNMRDLLIADGHSPEHADRRLAESPEAQDLKARAHPAQQQAAAAMTGRDYVRRVTMECKP